MHQSFGIRALRFSERLVVTPFTTLLQWAPLIVRDLAVRLRRYTDLLDGLPGIPTNMLATRLKELEQAGVIERRIASAPRVYAASATFDAVRGRLLGWV